MVEQIGKFCPWCGMEGTTKLFAQINKPFRLFCCFCEKALYDFEMIKDWTPNKDWNPNKRSISFSEMNKELHARKEIEEIKALKTKQNGDKQAME